MQNSEPAAIVAGITSQERREHQDRRRHTLRTLLYCGWRRRGRRTQIRRLGDNYYLDWYDPRLVYISFGILILSCCDAMLTLTLIGRGAHEANAFMASLLAINERVFVIGKVVITSAGVLFLLMHAHFRILRITTGKQVLKIVLSIYGLLIVYELLLLWRFG